MLGKRKAYNVRLVEVISVRGHMICGDLEVVEHSLELLRELHPALDFEFGEHPAFGVVRDRPALHESFCEMGLVVALEDVSFVDVPEHGDGLFEN